MCQQQRRAPGNAGLAAAALGTGIKVIAGQLKMPPPIASKALQLAA